MTFETITCTFVQVLGKISVVIAKDYILSYARDGRPIFMFFSFNCSKVQN
jgi:hypothetical protein